MTKGRLEAFSDGVLAIAITLLTLDLPIPLPGSPAVQAHGLWSALGKDWPQLAAYAVSFAFIGIIWVNHHSLMNRVAVVDRTLLFINLLLLLFVAAVPWATDLFAEYLLEGGIDSHVAAAVFSTNALCMALSFNLLWWWIRKDASRLHESIDPAVAKATARRYSVGIFIYAFAILVSFISAPAALAFHGVVACYYVVDQLPRGREAASETAED
ncbi:MAG TPA: TMEM175 family protein [Actinomycetota bacterium]|jgi:uncharacterized membrane protein